MSTHNPDINYEIQRILSSNIGNDLFSGITRQLLNSPATSKLGQSNVLLTSRVYSASRSQFQQDLYEKAQQIFKLKQLLETQLSNINQIVRQNQQLTQVNVLLESQLKKYKNQWRNFKKQVVEDIGRQRKQMIHIKDTTIQKTLHVVDKHINLRMQRNSELNLASIRLMDQKLNNINQKRQKLKLNYNVLQDISIFLLYKKGETNESYNNNFFAESQENKSQQNFFLKQKVKQLEIFVCSLKRGNKDLNNMTIVEDSLKQPVIKKEVQKRQSQIECYSSVFMKSISQEQNEKVDQTIRSYLYSPKRPLFQQLKQAKYFGRIILGKKNGKALQKYQNGFQYQGYFSKDKRNGLGKLFYKQKIVYSGQWKQGQFWGKGLLYYYSLQNVQKIQGNFRNGYLQGYSTITFKSGSKSRTKFIKNQISNDYGILICKIDNKQPQFQQTPVDKIQIQMYGQSNIDKIWSGTQGNKIQVL